MRVKVGLIGARQGRNGSGIGQFIAREILNYPHSDLVAIMGTTPESLQEARTDLNSRDDILTKFDGVNYTIKQSQQFFNNPEMDLVIICSPSETHEGYIKKALTTGKHVLVEKPLLHAPSIPFKNRIQKTDELIKLAQSKELFLSTNCQRAAGVQILCDRLNLPTRPSFIDIDFTISSKNKSFKKPQDLFELLIAHPLSLLVKYGVSDFESIKVESHSQKFDSRMSYLSLCGICRSTNRNLKYNIKLKQIKDISFSRMIIKLDDSSPIEISTEKSLNGQLQTRYIVLNGSNRIVHSEDHLKTSITKIIDAVLYQDAKHAPLITNSESYVIYALQERLKELLFSKNKV